MRRPREKTSEATSSAAVTAPHSQRRSSGAKEETTRIQRSPSGPVHLVTCTDEHGPDLWNEPFNPKTDWKSTLNSFVAQFVVYGGANMNELTNTLLRHTATLMIVLFDHLTGAEDNLKVLDGILNRGEWLRCKQLGVFCLDYLPHGPHP